MLAFVVTSPATCTWPVVTMVSTATREAGSWASIASRIESLIASHILSGWPSVTDSLVNNRRLISLTTAPHLTSFAALILAYGSQVLYPGDLTLGRE
ncbi:hypothetical protein FHU35_121236 [Saccharopolyspora dendranthemae]|uniref:Uncharacterized protein n=1 Tax=Saccharopolyspora dendranthemae TaxID=1181886 RepID=A0A561UA43_9PSEU|nr:hypothetical protein FHU35_121236 [Saccharopolyspora dendranthemae]